MEQVTIGGETYEVGDNLEATVVAENTGAEWDVDAEITGFREFIGKTFIDLEGERNGVPVEDIVEVR